jgi:predicted Zn-dependent protease with MMP-like domain
MSRNDFEKLVEEGISSIPEGFLRKLKNVRIVVEDEPSKKQLDRGHVHRGWTLYGLYEGVPQPSRGGGYNFAMPDKITIFQKPIEEACSTEEQIREQVKITVWHEIAHHFGLDEEEVRIKEKKRI